MMAMMEVGRSYLVRLFLDDKSRILATTKINRFLEETSEAFQVGEKVSLIIADKTDLGVKAIINHSYWGMLYQNELFRPVHQGQKLIDRNTSHDCRINTLFNRHIGLCS
ncbi:hypothetical protein [Methylovulum sp.]|uniref:hypothetical protein n=1 Tax=Methylovulum sp. TaxID=1916980 RepID=UPI0026132AEF|nr:hypothetical protein [Methylovulum sp.]